MSDSELLEFSLILLNCTKSQLIEKMKNTSVEFVNDDIENCDTQLVANICTCIGDEYICKNENIFEKWPKSNIYKVRKDKSIISTISSTKVDKGKFVINMFCYTFSNEDIEDIKKQLLRFESCLDKISRIKGIKSISFPWELCLKNEEKYNEMFYDKIRHFAIKNEKINVKVYKKVFEKQKHELELLKKLNDNLSNKKRLQLNLENFSSFEMLENFLEKFRRESNRTIFYQKFSTVKKDDFVYFVQESLDGNNPFCSDFKCSYNNFYHYIKNVAIKVPKFKDGWSDFFESVDDITKDISEKLSLEENNIYPPIEKVFTAFNLCEPKDIKVVIIGQDPYHKKGQAMGLSFCVDKDIASPPSLKNIYKELKSENYTVSDDANLLKWAKQGVFMINSALTVAESKAGSHSKMWERFTHRLITYINHNLKNIVFILWGNHAKKFSKIINTNKHSIVEGVHPSPLSAHGGFFGSKPFSKVNEKLQKYDKEIIDWNL